MILVAGATGYLGNDICRRLTASGERVRALVRPTSNPDMVGSLKAMNAEIVTGDLRDPPSLATACRGVRAVVVTATSIRSRQPGDTFAATDRQGLMALVDAAKEAGVAHVVFISASSALRSDDEFTRCKRAVETHLRASGMAYTILKPGPFMESWLSPALGFDYVNGNVTLVSDGTAPVSWVSMGDVAEMATRSLKTPAARNQEIEIGGPDALSLAEVTALFEKVAGRPFARVHVPDAALAAQEQSAPDELPRVYAALARAAGKGARIDPAAMRRIFPDLRLVTVQEYAGHVLAR